MALPPLATVEDVEERLGASVDDETRVESLLRYASALVRAETGCTFVTDADALVDPLPDGINEVVVGMLERAVQNPEGVTQDTTGPFTVSFGSDAAQRIYLTRGDKAILARRSCRGAGLWTQPTTRGEIETATVYVPPSNGGDPIPLLAEPPY